MEYRGKKLSTMGEVFDEALRIAKTNKDEAEDFFYQYVNDISSVNKYSWDKSIEIAKSNLGYFAGYYSQEVCDIIYDTYQCSHPIFGKKPYEVTPEDAFKKGLEIGSKLKRMK
jgi:hypothetical protein